MSSGSTFGASFGRFLDYNISLGQLGSLSGILQRSGQVVSTGHFDQTFSGLVSFSYFGPAVPTIADFEMQLFVFDLTQGDIDFFHTLSASLALPPGFTATSALLAFESAQKVAVVMLGAGVTRLALLKV